MVRINNIVLSGLAAVGAVAQKCMTNDEAAFVAANYGTLIANYTTALADKTLAVNFTDYAESVNSLINSCPQGSAAVTLPLLAPTFSSREQFEIGQGQQPAINFEQLNMWVSCNAVVIRWTTTNTAPIPNPKPVVGLIAMEVVPNPDATAAETYPWLIDTVYSEFDAAAWLQNLMDAGICATSSTATSSVVAPTATSSVGVGGIAESKATVTVTATVTAAGVCSTGYVPKPSGYASSSGYAHASGTGASGSWSAPTPTGSPIAPYKGAANAVNAAGLIAGAGAVAALFL